MSKNLSRKVVALTLIVLISAQLGIPVAYAEDEAAAPVPPPTESTPPTESAPESTAPAEASSESTNTESTGATSQTSQTTETAQESETTETASETATTTEPEPLIDPSSESAISEYVDEIATSTESGFVEGGATSDEESATTTPSAAEGSSNEPPAQNSAAADTPLAATTSDPTIVSGTAIAIANILNFLNTSFINSSGGFLVSNFLAEAPTIDLRDVSLFSGMCGPVPCLGTGGIQLNLLNDATINNDIIVNALSGQNFATGALGSSSKKSIETGNAFAGLNLINLANTTFIDSNYLLVTLNAFSGVNGDIVFPSLQNFFRAVTGSAAVAGGSNFTNDASVGNDVTASAESGNNTIEGADNSAIASGESGAYANVFNQINSILPDNRVSILFRISGAWRGNVYGVPENISQVRGPDGSIFLFGASSTASGAEPNLINSTSTANISNNVQVSALSGENGISHASTSLISTGNAFAGANIINIANQNVIGRNWILAIINIFGDFDGNISFGRPDLWIGDQADAPATLRSGSEITYKITVLNNGDADAHDVALTETPDFSHVEVLSSSLPYESAGGKLHWNIPQLAPGEGFEVTYTARVKSVGDDVAITNNSSVSGTPSDNNLADNTDSVTVRTAAFSGGTGGGNSSGVFFSGPGGTPLQSATSSTKKSAMLSVRRVTEHMLASTIEPRVSEFIVIRNGGDYPIKETVFKDVLRDPSGNILHVEQWNLDTVAPHEEITINYSISFASTTPSGIYTLSTELESSINKPAIFANGSITFMGNPSLPPLKPSEIPAVHITSRKATVEPVPLTPSTGALEDVPSIALTAAAAAGDGPASRRMIDLALFLLLFTTSYGALRLFMSPMKWMPF